MQPLNERCRWRRKVGVYQTRVRANDHGGTCAASSLVYQESLHWAHPQGHWVEYLCCDVKSLSALWRKVAPEEGFASPLIRGDHTPPSDTCGNAADGMDYVWRVPPLQSFPRAATEKTWLLQQFACMDGEMDRHKWCSALIMWSNVSALIIYLLWEGGREKGPAEMKWERVTTAPWRERPLWMQVSFWQITASYLFFVFINK